MYAHTLDEYAETLDDLTMDARMSPAVREVARGLLAHLWDESQDRGELMPEVRGEWG